MTRGCIIITITALQGEMTQNTIPYRTSTHLARIHFPDVVPAVQLFSARHIVILSLLLFDVILQTIARTPGFQQLKGGSIIVPTSESR